MYIPLVYVSSQNQIRFFFAKMSILWVFLDIFEILYNVKVQLKDLYYYTSMQNLFKFEIYTNLSRIEGKTLDYLIKSHFFFTFHYCLYNWYKMYISISDDFCEKMSQNSHKMPKLQGPIKILLKLLNTLKYKHLATPNA